MTEKKKMSPKEVGQGILGLVLMFGISWAFLGGSDEKSTEPAREPTAIKESKNWYEGGTLHKGKLADWKKATTENRLATAGDFIAKLTGDLDISKAIELKACLTTFSKGAEEEIINQKVAEAAVLCAAQLGYISQ